MPKQLDGRARCNAVSLLVAEYSIFCVQVHMQIRRDWKLTVREKKIPKELVTNRSHKYKR